MRGRTLKEAVETSKHPLNEGKPFGYSLGGGKLGYVVRRGDKVYYLSPTSGKIVSEVHKIDIERGNGIPLK